MCRDIAKLDGSKLKSTLASRNFSWAARGGGQRGAKKLERRPGGPRGSSWRRPVLRRRRSRITAYIQWILSTGASQEGPLKIRLGSSANIRRSRITAYMAAPALRTEIWNRIAAYTQCSVNSCRRSSGHRGEAASKIDLDGRRWSLHIYNGS